jgi:hypothetical protein
MGDQKILLTMRENCTAIAQKYCGAYGTREIMFGGGPLKAM